MPRTASAHAPRPALVSRDEQAAIYDRAQELLAAALQADDYGDQEEHRAIARIARERDLPVEVVERAFYAEENRRDSRSPAHALTTLGFDLSRPIFHVDDLDLERIVDGPSDDVPTQTVTTVDGFTCQIAVRPPRPVDPGAGAPGADPEAQSPKDSQAVLIPGYLRHLEPPESSRQAAQSYPQTGPQAHTVLLYLGRAFPRTALLQITPDLPKSLQPLPRLVIAEPEPEPERRPLTPQDHQALHDQVQALIDHGLEAREASAQIAPAFHCTPGTVLGYYYAERTRRGR